jgi:hypothetical protein
VSAGQKPPCRPLARPEEGRYRPACECTWESLGTLANRAEALHRAYDHEDRELARLNG